MHHPILTDLPPKASPTHLRVYRVEYVFKTELDGWRPGLPFCFSAYSDMKVDTGKVLASAAREHPDAIGVEITGMPLYTPLTSEPS